MDGARRKMRDEVERREAAARGEAYPKRQTAVVAEPTDPESRARRANAKRGEPTSVYNDSVFETRKCIEMTLF